MIQPAETFRYRCWSYSTSLPTASLLPMRSRRRSLLFARFAALWHGRAA